MDDRGRPQPPPAARPPRALGQPLEDLADCHPLVDQPAVQGPHQLGLDLVDRQVSGHAIAGRDVAVAVGGPPGDPGAGPGLLQLATAEAVAEQGPLVLGDGALDLEQELVVRVVGDRPLDELDVAAVLAELLQEEDLVGVLAGQAVGAEDGQDVELAVAGGVPQAVESGAVQALAGVALVGEDVLGAELMAAG